MNWKKTRIDRVASVNARIGWKALTASEYQSDGYVFLATPNIKPQSIDFENVNYIGEYRYEESPELKLRPGDVLLAKDGSTLGITNIVRELPRPATVNSSIAVLRAFEVEPRFLRYALASSATQNLIETIKGGMGVPHLFQWDIKRLPITIPSPGEQSRIADFLDAETAQIDRLVALRSSQMEVLGAHYQSYLSELAHELRSQYGSVKVRHVLQKIEQGWSPQCEDRSVKDGEWGVVKAGCVNGGIFDPSQHKALPSDTAPEVRYRLRPGDLLLSRASGSIDLIGSTAVLPDDLSAQLLLCDKVYRLRMDRTRMMPHFVAFMLRAIQVREAIKLGISGAEGMANNLPTAIITNLPLPNVPIMQQACIVDDLDNTWRTVQEAGQKLTEQLSVLSERRQTLITEAVTGEITI